MSDQQEKTYRGALVYRRESGYWLVTMTVSRFTPQETTQVVTHAFDLPIEEQAEHLEGVDLYHFPVYTGTHIHLRIAGASMGEQEAWYTVSTATCILEDSLTIWLDVLESSESSGRAK